MRITRPASELAAALRKRVPGIVADIERRHGFRLEDVLHRRALQESQQFLADLAVELYRQRHWSPVEIARSLDTDQRAVERALVRGMPKKEASR